ncbi:MAG: hypothetical protein ACPH74_10370 [Candidatus Puniceispirillum sp.]
MDDGDDWSTENRSDWSFGYENSASDELITFVGISLYRGVIYSCKSIIYYESIAASHNNFVAKFIQR